MWQVSCYATLSHYGWIKRWWSCKCYSDKAAWRWMLQLGKVRWADSSSWYELLHAKSKKTDMLSPLTREGLAGRCWLLDSRQQTTVCRALTCYTDCDLPHWKMHLRQCAAHRQSERQPEGSHGYLLQTAAEVLQGVYLAVGRHEATKEYQQIPTN